MKKSFTAPLILAAVILLLSACNLQKKMLYYPESYTPSSEMLVQEGLQFWPEKDGYRGFVSTGGVPATRGTVVVFHGNAGTASDRTYYVKALAPLGFRVVLSEYPGYGQRDGTPGEKEFVEDGRETLRRVKDQYGEPIYLLGESLGCGVAAAVAGQAPVPIKGIILITPWDTLLSVAKEKFPWLPVRLFLSDRYDSISNLKEFPARIAVVGAERDEVIPIHHAEQLYASLQGEKRMWTIRGAGHNDWPDAVDPRWWKEMTDWVIRQNAR